LEYWNAGTFGMAGSKEFLQYSDIPLFQRDIRNQMSLKTFII
jgi:hypothetical protein